MSDISQYCYGMIYSSDNIGVLFRFGRDTESEMGGVINIDASTDRFLLTYANGAKQYVQIVPASEYQPSSTLEIPENFESPTGTEYALVTTPVISN